MGLDCWLYITKYIYSDEQAKRDELRELVREKINGKNEVFDDMKDYELKELKWEVGYWRKANQIHNWFVQNIQNGEDDCGNYSVDKEKLQELLETINKILNEKDKTKYETLCWNCNLGKNRNNGVCPHKIKNERKGNQ